MEHIIVFYIFSFGSFTFRPIHFFGPQFYSLKLLNGLGYIFELDEYRSNLGLKLSIWALFHLSELTEQEAHQKKKNKKTEKGTDKAVKVVTQEEEPTTTTTTMECAGKGRGTRCLGPPRKRCHRCGAVAYCSASHQV